MSPKLAVCLIYIAGTFLVVIDTTALNVALPAIASDFRVSPTDVSAVSIAYQVSLAVCIPTSGWLGDRFGDKRLLIAAVTIFTGASVLCGLAGGLAELVAFRILQGVGGGLLTPIGMAMLFRVFPPAERIRVMSLMAAPAALAPAIGPFVGGVLVTGLSWRWVFYINAPIGLAALVIAGVWLVNEAHGSARRFDVAGFLVVGAGFAALMYGVSVGSERGWGAPASLPCVVTGLVMLGLFVPLQLRRAEPLVALRLFENRSFRWSTLTISVSICAFHGVIFGVSLYLQAGRGLTALQAGLTTIPEAVGVMAGTQLSSKCFFRRFHTAHYVSVSLVAAAASMATLAALPPTSNLWLVRLAMFAMGFSIGQVVIATQFTAFVTVSKEKTGQGSTIYNAARQISGAIGVAILTTVIVLRSDGGDTTRADSGLWIYRTAFLTASAIALFAIVWATRLRRDPSTPSTPSAVDEQVDVPSDGVEYAE